MIRTRLLTGAAAITMLMAGTAQQTMAQQARVSVQVVVAPISRIAFTGTPGVHASDEAYAGVDASAAASAAAANAMTSAAAANPAPSTAPSFMDAELRATALHSLELSVAEAMQGGHALCATAADRRSARSTGPMPRLSVSYAADGGDSEEPVPTITCTLIAP